MNKENENPDDPFLDEKVLADDFDVVDGSKNAKTIMVPVTYGGRLPVGPESDFSYVYDREDVDIRRNLQTIVVPVTFKGKLPPGKERL